MDLTLIFLHFLSFFSIPWRLVKLSLQAACSKPIRNVTSLSFLFFTHKKELSRNESCKNRNNPKLSRPGTCLTSLFTQKVCANCLNRLYCNMGVLQCRVLHGAPVCEVGSHEKVSTKSLLQGVSFEGISFEKVRKDQEAPTYLLFFF